MNPNSELVKLNDDWDKMVRLTSSLERYEELLRSKGKVSDDVAYVMSVALENIDPEFDIKEGSAITLRAIKEAIAAGAKAVWAIIKQVWQFLNSMYIKFTGSIRRVRSSQTNTQRRLGKLGSKTSTQTTLSVAGVQRLSIDGKFVGVDLQPLEDIKQITNYCLNIYPKSITQIARDASRGFLNILDETEGKNGREVAEEVVTAFAEAFESKFRKPPGSTPLKEGNGPDTGQRRSDVLPGNVAFVYVDPATMIKELKSGKGAPEQIVNKGFVMKFTELQMNVADRSEREIELPSVKDLTNLTDEIARILTLAERAESSRRDFETVKTVVDDSIRQIMERTDSGEQVPASNFVLQVLGEVSRKLAEPMDNFTHWLAITLNVWLTFINHCIDHYEKEGI